MTSTTEQDDEMRSLARTCLAKKRDFKVHLFFYIAVNTVLIGVWAATGAGLFWPVFPILGWGIGLSANAWDTYWRAPIDEDQIQREVARLSGRG